MGWQGSDRNAARTNTMSRFETETLTQEDNLKGLALMNPQWVELAMAHTPHRRVILDMDSSESPVHGQQEGAAYNGHFECVCYHPLFLFNQFGDCEGATLRPGNVHSADGWQELLEPVVKGYQKKGLRLLFRGDAAFAKPELYEYLEQGKIGYAIRLPANQVIQEQIQPLLERPTEWPSREPIVSYHDFAYQAQSWHLPRRVVAKVEWHQGELFPRVGFIVTNLSYPPKGIVRFYNGRGTAEQWIKEGKYALNWTRLSCHKFVANQVRLWSCRVEILLRRVSRRRSGSGSTRSARGWRGCWSCRRRTRSCVLRTSRLRQTASVRESVLTSNPESGKRCNDTKGRNWQCLTSAHRNGCHCGHRPRSPASVPTTATGPHSPAAVPRSREVTLNLTRDPPSSLMRSGATSHIPTSFRTLSMPKPRDSVVSRAAQPHPENLPPVIHVDPPGKVRIGTQARRFQICGSYDACRDRADSRERGN